MTVRSSAEKGHPILPCARYASHVSARTASAPSLHPDPRPRRRPRAPAAHPRCPRRRPRVATATPTIPARLAFQHETARLACGLMLERKSRRWSWGGATVLHIRAMTTSCTQIVGSQSAHHRLALHDGRMRRLADRAVLSSPLPLITVAEAGVLGA